jgi:hypothetical protein
MNDKDYDWAVRSIPHLNITKYLPKIPLEQMIDEVETEEKTIKPFEYGIDTQKRPEMQKIVDYLSESWQGFGIIDITARGDHMIDYLTEDITHERVKDLGIEFDENGYGVYKPTDVGKRMTATVKYLQTIFQSVGRVRLSRLKAGRVIGYHNHEVKSLIDRQKLKKPLISPGVNRSTLHIPLIENDKSSHYVTKGYAVDYVDSDRFILEEDAVEYIQHYAVGEAWLFNSVHYHKAVNFGNSDRTHILCYFDHMDEKIRPYIEKSIEDYQGPYIV